ncbi:hypothetical protein JW851_04820 [Candidatus Woesearchaeota archaeon]|nr:hypothetical protein [Candidatus Woesearchaeota archaeon]
MKWVVVFLILIILSSFVSAEWNINYSNDCGNNAVEMGEQCDPPGKECYTEDYTQGKCTKDCTCEEYTGPSCGNSFVETGEDCETDNDCPVFYYCNANCRCIAKVAPSQNITEEIIEEENIDEKETPKTEPNNTNVVYEEFIVNESFFEMEKFNESFGIKITGAITKATKSVFGGLFKLIKRWFA